MVSGVTGECLAKALGRSWRAKKMPFFCRLEMQFLLRAGELGRILIGRSAIRNRAGERQVLGFRWWVAGFDRLGFGFEIVSLATAVMAQNPDGMIAHK